MNSQPRSEINRQARRAGGREAQPAQRCFSAHVQHVHDFYSRSLACRILSDWHLRSHSNVSALWHSAGRENLVGGFAPWLVYFVPAWGVFQIVAHTTASTFETREAVLRWGALAAVFFLTQVAVRTRADREIMLLAFLKFATAMAVLCLLQLFTSEGSVLWVFPSGYKEVFATFQYDNNYAQFVEVSLPIALWWAVREGWRGWGFALWRCALRVRDRLRLAVWNDPRPDSTAELLAVVAFGLVLRKRQKPGRLFHSTALPLIIVPLLAVVFTLCCGLATGLGSL